MKNRRGWPVTVFVIRTTPFVASTSRLVSFGQVERGALSVLVACTSIFDTRLDVIELPLVVVTTNSIWELFKKLGVSSFSGDGGETSTLMISRVLRA
jgi:hypothetical protein